MSRKKGYHVIESLRIAASLTFISGYLNAFTYITQGGRFAGVQSGNIIMLSYHFAKGEWHQAFSFSIPIFFFVLGQLFIYIVKQWFLNHHLPWYFWSSIMILACLLIGSFCSPFLSPFFTIALLAFVASLQIGTFQKLRGAAYANVMMTGNLKNAAYLWFKGRIEKDKELQKRAHEIFIILFSFSLGVGLSTLLSLHFKEYALSATLLPMIYVNIKLWKEEGNKK